VQGRWCYPIERCLKVVRSKYKNKGKIEPSVAEAYIRRRCQTSQQQTMVTTFPAYIIHPLATILAKINRTSAFFEGSSEVQVIGNPRHWDMKSGAISYYMCWLTISKWRRTCSKFTTNLLNTLSLFGIQPHCFSLLQGISLSLMASIKGTYPAGMWYPS
jgi:hypothetical protein